MFNLNTSESIDRFGWINNEMNINECITKCYKPVKETVFMDAMHNCCGSYDLRLS